MATFGTPIGRISRILWIVAFTISAVVCVFAAAVWIGLWFGNPGTPKVGHPKIQKQRTKLQVSTVRVHWRDHVDVGSSEAITVSLTNPGTKEQLPCQVGGTADGQVNHIGKQGVPLTIAFGPGYTGYASARLDAIGFNATATNQGMESLNQHRIDWSWVISPKTSGEQYAVVSVSGTWHSCFGATSDIHRELWMSAPIGIAVDQPLLERSSFDVVGFLTGTAGASSVFLVLARFLGYLLQLLWMKLQLRNATPSESRLGETTICKIASTSLKNVRFLRLWAMHCPKLYAEPPSIISPLSPSPCFLI